MRTPQNLQDAKAIIREEKAKVTNALSALAGSRWLMAILTTLAIAFSVNLLYSPDELPAIGGVSFATIGLPPGLDFGIVGEQAVQAREAAERQGATNEIAAYLAAHPDLIPLLNAAGLGLSMLLLLGNMWIMTLRRPFSRG